MSTRISRMSVVLRGTAFSILILTTCLSSPNATATEIVVDFEDLTLSPESANQAGANAQPFLSHGVEFKRGWNHEFDCCPSGFAYSNQTDILTAGFGNQLSAYVLPSGGGVDGSANYAVANNNLRGEAAVRFAEPSIASGMFVANTTYGYLAVSKGDDGGANFVKGPFEVGDWFKLDIFGIDETGNDVGFVEFFLSDFVNDSHTISDWTWVDLSSLGTVSSLEFEMSSSDTGLFGMNTPAYFAIDNLSIQSVPEPSPTILFGIGALVFARFSVRR